MNLNYFWTFHQYEPINPLYYLTGIFSGTYSVLGTIEGNGVITVNVTDKNPAFIEPISGGEQAINKCMTQCQIATSAMKENKVG